MWLLVERLFSREPEVTEEMRIVRDVAESGAQPASLVPDPPFPTMNSIDDLGLLDCCESETCHS
jgi:hypothetical protein